MVTIPIYKRLMYKERKEKYIRTSLHPSKSINTPPNKKKKKSLILTLPLSTRLLSSQNYSPFLSRMKKGKSSRGHHLIITGKASILILIITIIKILICRSLWRRRGRGSKTTKASLSSCYTTDTGFHLTHLVDERVKVSIHVLKLRHDGL